MKIEKRNSLITGLFPEERIIMGLFPEDWHEEALKALREITGFLGRLESQDSLKLESGSHRIPSKLKIGITSHGDEQAYENEGCPLTIGLSKLTIGRLKG